MYKTTLSSEWKLFLRQKNNKVEFFISLFLLVISLVLLANWLTYAEKRDGVTLNDPVLNILPAVNLSWLIFSLIYVSLFISLLYLAGNPRLLTLTIKSYLIMVLFRITAMYAAPLDPPYNMIPLPDPFVETFGTGRLLTKDLFFSGHTATLFILFFTAGHKKLKIFLLFSAVVVAVSVLLQHVHYTIDVLCAPFFAYSAFRIAGKMKLKEVPKL